MLVVVWLGACAPRGGALATPAVAAPPLALGAEPVVLVRGEQMVWDVFWQGLTIGRAELRVGPHDARSVFTTGTLASALGTLRVQVVKVDRDTLLTTAAATLDLDEAKITTSLKALRPENGGLWRQEQRHAALAAWLTLARPGNRTHAR